MKPFITLSDLQAIWARHQLGQVHEVQQPARGASNQTLFVNRHYVIRFDMLGGDLARRFESEVQAYRDLGAADIPVPEVLVLDQSQALVPYTYLITNRMDGLPAADTWHQLSLRQQYRIAQQAGRFLAVIHAQTYPHFGRLTATPLERFAGWYACSIDHLDSCLRRAVYGAHPLHIEIVRRLQHLFEAARPLLDAVTTPVLLHGDYHFGNILQRRGRVSGVIDFEWTKAGDAVWDFIAEEQWEVMCPGSRRWIYESYQQHRPLPADHQRRLALYKIILYLETAVNYQRQDDWQGYALAVERLIAEADRIEDFL